jgi:hypothetical protein
VTAGRQIEGVVRAVELEGIADADLLSQGNRHGS